MELDFVTDVRALFAADLGEEHAAIEDANSALPVRFEVPVNWALE